MLMSIQNYIYNNGFWNVQIKNYVHYIHTLYQKIALLQLYNFQSLHYDK